MDLDTEVMADSHLGVFTESFMLTITDPHWAQQCFIDFNLLHIDFGSPWLLFALHDIKTSPTDGNICFS